MTRDWIRDHFGAFWLSLIPAQTGTEPKQFSKKELEAILTAINRQAAFLRSERGRIVAIDKIEEVAEEKLASLPSEQEMNKLIRYATHYERQFYRALAELERHQARRKGEAVLPRMQVQLG